MSLTKAMANPNTGSHDQQSLYTHEQWDSTAKKNARHHYTYFSIGDMLRGTLDAYFCLGV